MTRINGVQNYFENGTYLWHYLNCKIWIWFLIIAEKFQIYEGAFYEVECMSDIMLCKCHAIFIYFF